MDPPNFYCPFLLYCIFVPAHRLAPFLHVFVRMGILIWCLIISYVFFWPFQWILFQFLFLRAFFSSSDLHCSPLSWVAYSFPESINLIKLCTHLFILNCISSTPNKLPLIILLLLLMTTLCSRIKLTSSASIFSVLTDSFRVCRLSVAKLQKDRKGRRKQISGFLCMFSLVQV